MIEPNNGQVVSTTHDARARYTGERLLRERPRVYRRLFESAALGVLDVRSPLATGKEATRWVSETTTAPWTIYVLGRDSRLR
jgi:hypothetical protein